MMGPSVIRRKSSDAGYLVVFRNENSAGIGGEPFRPGCGGMPRARIAVQVESAKHEKESDGRESDRQAESLSSRGLQGQDLAEGVTCRHDANPRNDRVEHDEVRTVGAKLDRAGKESHVHDFPETGEADCRRAPRADLPMCESIRL